jgi:hypothetical protein
MLLSTTISMSCISTMTALFVFSSSLGAQQWSCRDQYGQPLQPQFGVNYGAYIPVDHVDAPTPCSLGNLPLPKIYKGDPSAYVGDDRPLYSYRVAQGIFVRNEQQYTAGYWYGVGATRNYGDGSPANGSTLSDLDEDGVQYDCWQWNDAGLADSGDIHYDMSFPYSTQSQTHFYGTATNPLESVRAPIAWDFRAVIDDSSWTNPTAYVNYNHSCYPAHRVYVNGHSVYHYVPPRNDSDYITGCLLFQRDKLIGQTSSTSVPCN